MRCWTANGPGTALGCAADHGGERARARASVLTLFFLRGRAWPAGLRPAHAHRHAWCHSQFPGDHCAVRPRCHPERPTGRVCARCADAQPPPARLLRSPRKKKTFHGRPPLPLSLLKTHPSAASSTAEPSRPAHRGRADRSAAASAPGAAWPSATVATACAADGGSALAVEPAARAATAAPTRAQRDPALRRAMVAGFFLEDEAHAERQRAQGKGGDRHGRGAHKVEV